MQMIFKRIIKIPDAKGINTNIFLKIHVLLKNHVSSHTAPLL